MSAEYRDRWIRCTDEHLAIRGYYFPWGTKRIPYGRIRGVRRVRLGVAHGKGRMWGTANPRYWASLDPRRAGKETALVLDLGRPVQPVITPDDPDAVEACIRAHTSIDAARDATARAPVI
jgi:hypothetical protein